MECRSQQIHELDSSCSHISLRGVFFRSNARCSKIDRKTQIVAPPRPVPDCVYRRWPGPIFVPGCRTSQTAKHEPKLQEMELRVPAGWNNVDTKRINKGDRIPHVRERETPNNGLSEIDGYSNYLSHLRDSISPVRLVHLRKSFIRQDMFEILLKKIDRFGAIEVVELCYTNKKAYHPANLEILLFTGLDRFIREANPKFKIDLDFIVVGEER